MEALKFFLMLSLFALSLGNRCQAASSRKFIFYSSIFTEVVDSSYKYISRAVPCKYYQGWQNITGAPWIWNEYEPSNVGFVYFRAQFFISGTPLAANLQVLVDDQVKILINDKESDCENASYYYLKSCNITLLLSPGKNTAIFLARDYGGLAGLVYKIDIDIN